MDDVLPAYEMAEMRRHMAVCQSCATLDVRIRRSLLVVRNLPQIELSPDFFTRLSERLQEAPSESATRRMPIAAAVFAASAAIAAAVYFAVAAGSHDTLRISPAPRQIVAASAPTASQPVADAALVATVPAGVPLWPAMFMVGELPMHLANAELLDNGIGR